VHGRDQVSVFAARHVADAARSGAALPLWRAAESLAFTTLGQGPSWCGLHDHHPVSSARADRGRARRPAPVGLDDLDLDLEALAGVRE
jgi:hypothetical protein